MLYVCTLDGIAVPHAPGYEKLRLTMSQPHDVIIYIKNILIYEVFGGPIKKLSDQIHLSPNSFIFAYMC
jgi:hypothetical protein